MKDAYLPVACATCARFTGFVSKDGAQVALKNRRGFIEPSVLGACHAFPHGIPPDILDESNDHRSPHDGDRGLTWRSLK